MYIRECKTCMILHVQCEGFLVCLHAEDLPLVDRALCNALVALVGPTHELAVARCQIFQHRYILVNCHIKLWKITIFYGKTHYFNGHFQ